MRPFHCFFVLLIFVSVKATGQSGWVKPKGKFYVESSISTFSSDEYYSLEGKLNPDGNRFFSHAFTVYGEYGITDRLTVLANLPLLKLNRFNVTNTVAGVGDLRMGVKYGLFKNFPLAISVEPEIPTGNGVQFAEAREENDLGFREEINLPTTDGEFNVWTTLAVSQSTNSGNTYGSLFGAYNFRTQGYSNQFRAGVEAGQYLFDRLWLIGRMNVQTRASNEEPQNVSFLYGEGTTYTSYGLTAQFKLNAHWRLTGSYFDYAGFLVERRNIYDGPTFMLGVAVEY